MKDIPGKNTIVEGVFNITPLLNISESKSDHVANGVYLIKVNSGSTSKVLRVSVNR